MMAKSLRGIPGQFWIDTPTPKELLEDSKVSTLNWLHQTYGVPTPISGDPIAR